MAILTVNNISLSFGEESILEHVSFELQKGQRAGLVGVNGSGKTSLFKVLTGEYAPDSGSVTLSRDAVLGYMEQHVCRDLQRPAFDEVLSVFAPLLRMERELEDVTALLAQQPQDLDRLVLRQAELTERFQDAGGLTFRSRARSALLGLGFTQEQLFLPVGVLSGGQKAKLQLAKMLLSGASLLLLDEPTNHLDIQAVEWLEDFLKSYNGAYLVVSHDRYFLDKVTEITLEMDHKTITYYKGNYSRSLDLRAEHRLAMEREYEKTQREIHRIEGIIEQQRRWNQARNYVTIASKQKQIDRLSATLEKPQEDPAAIRFQFHASRRSGDDVLLAQELALSFGGEPLFQHASLDVKRGERVFLIGPNGCGKTTLLRLLLGQLAPSEGVVRLGTGVELGYYEQSQQSLHDGKTVMDEIWDEHPQMTQTQVRNALAVFLFTGEDVFKGVGTLSGGERARVLLLKLMLSKANLLLLDEPTNHLDITSREALEEALSGYDGTLLVVSHDRYLINKLADKVVLLTPQGTRTYLGNYDQYLEEREKGGCTPGMPASCVPQGRKGPSEANGADVYYPLDQARRFAAAPRREETAQALGYKERKAKASELRKKRGALGRLETAIEETENRQRALEESLEDPAVAADYEKVAAISQELARLRQEGERLLEEWATLSGELEAGAPAEQDAPRGGG